MRRTAVTALVALMVLLAGCGAAFQGTTTTDSPASTSSDAISPSSGTVEGATGTIAFYVSDQPAAIEDFEHLNVTIEKVGLHKAGADEEPTEDAEEEENETTTTTTTATTDSTANETDGNETTTTTTATTEEDDGDEGDASEEDDKDGSGDWVTYEVDNRTVDLTELKGANATRLANLTAPDGTYDTVFVYVSDVEGVLKDGGETNVKLPSQKLQLHTTFEIGPNATTDFVYDIAVHKAGQSGTYILKPNIAESGTQVEIRDVDRDRDRDRDEDRERDDDAEEEAEDENGADAGMDEEMNETETENAGENDGKEEDANDAADGPGEQAGLSIALDGNVTAGESVTVVVTNDDGGGVAGADVFVDGDEVGQTDGDGRLEITVPEDGDELEIRVEKAGAEAELEREIGG